MAGAYRAYDAGVFRSLTTGNFIDFSRSVARDTLDCAI